MEFTPTNKSSLLSCLHSYSLWWSSGTLDHLKCELNLMKLKLCQQLNFLNSSASRIICPFVAARWPPSALLHLIPPFKFLIKLFQALHSERKLMVRPELWPSPSPYSECMQDNEWICGWKWVGRSIVKRPWIVFFCFLARVASLNAETMIWDEGWTKKDSKIFLSFGCRASTININ